MIKIKMYKLSYSWRQLSGPPIELNSSDTTNPIFTAPVVKSDTELIFSFVSKDDKGATSNPATMTITIKHINHNPIADAGPYQIGKTGYVVSLNGSKSKDPDSDPITFSWTQTAGPPVKIFGSEFTYCHLRRSFQYII